LHFQADGRYTNWLMSGERVDIPTGTIASIALRNTPVTFDYVHHQMIVEDAASLAERKRTSTRIAIELQDDRGIALDIFARFDFATGKVVSAKSTPVRKATSSTEATRRSSECISTTRR
jgi:hypothetical protein